LKDTVKRRELGLRVDERRSEREERKLDISEENLVKYNTSSSKLAFRYNGTKASQ